MVGTAQRGDAPSVKTSALEWGKAFLSCGEAGIRGFQPKHLTPYCHFLMTHSPAYVAEFGGLRKFSGEKLEHLNDEFKKSHLRQTNCKDVCVTLRIQKRRELALRNQAIRKMNKNAQTPVKMGCQVSLNKQYCNGLRNWFYISQLRGVVELHIFYSFAFLKSFAIQYFYENHIMMII